VVAVVLLGLGVAAVWAVVALVGRGTSPEGFSDTAGAQVESMSIASKSTGETLPVNVVVPEDGGEGRPLFVFLHGRGDNGEESVLYDELFAALAEQGERAPVVAIPSGGESSYWHDRDSGEWGAWVTDEVIPQVRKEFDTDAARVAIGGISMGGFGAFDIARIHPGEFCAVGGHSPALWLSGGETAPGAFDDAEDFAAHDVVGAAASAPGPYLEAPIWLDAGEEDPFRPGIDAFAERLEAAGADLSYRVWPGGHETEYWQDHWDEYMRFYARALERC
jgi:enterochelin esterase-like enzyme